MTSRRQPRDVAQESHSSRFGIANLCQKPRGLLNLGRGCDRAFVIMTEWKDLAEKVHRVGCVSIRLGGLSQQVGGEWPAGGHSLEKLLSETSTFGIAGRVVAAAETISPFRP